MEYAQRLILPRRLTIGNKHRDPIPFPFALKSLKG